MRQRERLSIIFTQQYVDDSLLANQTENIFVLVRFINPLEIGRGIGTLLTKVINLDPFFSVLFIPWPTL